MLDLGHRLFWDKESEGQFSSSNDYVSPLGFGLLVSHLNSHVNSSGASLAC